MFSFGKKQTGIFSIFTGGKSIQEAILDTISRFPSATALMIVLSGLWYYMIAVNSNNNEFGAISVALILAILFSIALETATEETKRTLATRAGVVLGPIVFGAIQYAWARQFELQSAEYIGYTLLHGAIGLSLVFIGAYWEKARSNNDYTRYYLQVGGTIAQTALLGLMTLLLGYLGLYSLEELFGIHSSNSYGYWAVFSLANLAFFYGLTNFPKSEKSAKNATFPFQAILRFSCTYILIPAVTIYFVILYAYSLKVLLNFREWPEGIISWLIIFFSVIGYKTYALSFAIELPESFSKKASFRESFLAFFRKWLPRLILPQLIMLFYAIYLRIAQYDLTMNRYFVVIFGIWLFGISLYLGFTKEKKLVYIPISLAFVALGISIGPWGVMSLPYHRQLIALDANMTQVGILQNGKITPLDDKTFSKTPEAIETLRSIQSGIRYLCDYRQCEDIRTKFANELVDIGKDGNSYSYKQTSRNGKEYYSSWSIENEISKKLKIDIILDSIPNEYQTNYLRAENSISLYSSTPIEVTGYDTIVNFTSNPQFTFTLLDRTKLDIYNKTTSTSETVDISKFFTNLEGKVGAVPNTELTFETSTSTHRFKFLFSEYRKEQDVLTAASESRKLSSYMEGIVLIGEK